MSKAIISDTIQAVKAAPVAAPAPTLTQEAQQRPGVIVVTDRIDLAFDVAAVHIRAGYVVSQVNPPEIFLSQGQAVVTLELGNPSAVAIAAAEASTAYAIEKQRAAYARDVENAARQMVEDTARKAKQEQLAADVLEAKKALRRLQDAAAAA